MQLQKDTHRISDESCSKKMDAVLSGSRKRMLNLIFIKYLS